MKIYLEVDVHDYDSGWGSDSLSVKAFKLNELLDSLNQHEMCGLGYVRHAPLHDGSIDPIILNNMSNWGWVNARSLDEKGKQALFDKTFYITEKNGKYRRIDVDNPNWMDIDELAKGAAVMRSIKASSVLSKAARNKLTQAKKELNKKLRKNKEIADKRAATKKQKAIEKAKQLLAENQK